MLHELLAAIQKFDQTDERSHHLNDTADPYPDYPTSDSYSSSSSTSSDDDQFAPKRFRRTRRSGKGHILSWTEQQVQDWINTFDFGHFYRRVFRAINGRLLRRLQTKDLERLGLSTIHAVVLNSEIQAAVVRMMKDDINLNINSKTFSTLSERRKQPRESICFFPTEPEDEDLATHDNNAEYETISFECRYCAAIFRHKDDLEKHHRKEHSGEKKFVCRWKGCNMRFLKRKLFLEHSRTHSDDKPHNCPTCGKCFSRRNNLFRHMRTHLGIRPFQCNIGDCKKQFSTKSNLETHRRTHSKQCKFQCEFCDRIFVRPAYYLKHLGQKHGKTRNISTMVSLNLLDQKRASPFRSYLRGKQPMTRHSERHLEECSSDSE